MLPVDDDRRTYACCGIMILLPIVLSAAQVTVNEIVERWVTVPGVATAMMPLFFFNGIVSGVGAAWAALLLPGGRTRFNIVAAGAAFVVAGAVYVVSLVPFAIVAEIVV